MTVEEKIKETKSNGIFVEVPLIGDGSDNNAFRPQIFDEGNFYVHLDADEINYEHKKARVWINKKRTPDKDIKNLRKNIDNPQKPHKKIKEMKEGKEIAGRRKRKNR